MSSSNRTAFGLGAKVCIPNLFNLSAMLFDYADQSADFAGAKAIVVSQPDLRKQPELRIYIGSGNVDMDRFAG